MIDFLTTLLTSILGTSFVMIIMYFSFIRRVKSNPRIRKYIFAFFEVQDYIDLVKESYLNISNRKSKIQDVIRNSMGKDGNDVAQQIELNFKKLDEIMIHHQKKKDELEKRLLGEVVSKE